MIRVCTPMLVRQEAGQFSVQPVGGLAGPLSAGGFDLQPGPPPLLMSQQANGPPMPRNPCDPIAALAERLSALERRMPPPAVKQQ
jgi:hypothetical protein